MFRTFIIVLVLDLSQSIDALSILLHAVDKSEHAAQDQESFFHYRGSTHQERQLWRPSRFSSQTSFENDSTLHEASSSVNIALNVTSAILNSQRRLIIGNWEDALHTETSHLHTEGLVRIYFIPVRYKTASSVTSKFCTCTRSGCHVCIATA